MTCPTCRKGSRAVLYCHRPVCGLRPAPDDLVGVLPRPGVTVVQTSDGKSHVVISRNGGSTESKHQTRSYEIEGTTTEEKVQKTVEKVISDRYTGEWLP